MDINNGDLDCLSTKLIRQKHVEELAAAKTVTVTFDQMSEKDAYYLLLALRGDNSGYKMKRPVSIIIGHEAVSEKLNKFLAKDQET